MLISYLPNDPSLQCRGTPLACLEHLVLSLISLLMHTPCHPLCSVGAISNEPFCLLRLAVLAVGLGQGQQKGDHGWVFLAAPSLLCAAAWQWLLLSGDSLLSSSSAGLAAPRLTFTSQAEAMPVSVRLSGLCHLSQCSLYLANFPFKASAVEQWSITQFPQYSTDLKDDFP